ncbi:MAG: ABC transporter ATP-binding protein, partial [Clostridia bacterium]|nr:ABC transporter ATP-binding protein [Clostridia bacterium]
MKKQPNRNRALVMDSLHGYKRYLLLAAVEVLIATLMLYLTSYVTSFALDYVLLGDDPSLPKWLFDFLVAHSDVTKTYWFCGLLFFVFTVLNGLFTFLRRRNVSVASEQMAKKMRDTLYCHLNEVPYDYHKHVSTGDLVQRCTSDVDTVRRFIANQMMEIVRTVVMFFTALVMMLAIDVRMSLISMVTLPILAVLSFVYFRFVRKYFTEADEAEGALSTAIQENLTGVRVVRAFGQQRAEYDKFTKLNTDYRQKNIFLNRLMAYYWSGSDAIGYVQIALSLVFGVYFYAQTRGTADPFTLGNIYLFLSLTNRLTWPVRQLGRILADLGKATVSLNRLNEILNVPAEAEPGAAKRDIDLVGDITFDHVCFGYDTPNDVLDDISFTVKAGQTVAILGSTGSGKSSLVQLLQRLYTTTSGTISIGGTPINDIDHETLRRNIAIVLQEPFLYSRTIKENIKLVRPDATDEDMYDVAKEAAVHDVIMSFADGYDTIVGERGVTLSGGQQQRVAIARALMQNAPILIFDDSMSAVDTETDAKIRDSLHARHGAGILFLISHRITTLCEADVILVLEHGKLVQMGTHDELMQQDGLYRRIAEIQDAPVKG